MTSEIPQIIGEPKDGKNFLNARVFASYIHDEVLLSSTPTITDFQRLLDLRKQSQDLPELEMALNSKGYQLANVGISASIIVNYQGENYFLATRADRVDREIPDTVAKLLSGYVPAHLMQVPELHMRREIAEEFLPMVNGKIIPLTLEDIALDQPFSIENVSDSERAVPYSDEHIYSIQKGNNFLLPGMKRGKISIKSGGIEYAFGDHTEFHVAADTNSGQLVFKYNLDLQDYPGLSLHHTEEKLRPGTSLLDSHFHSEGILLIKLDPNLKLTGEAYTLDNGKLKHYTLPVVLSEAFAPKQNGISTIGNIGLGEYIKAQN